MTSANSSEYTSMRQDDDSQETQTLSKFEFSKLFGTQDSNHLARKRINDLLPMATESIETLYETESSTMFLKEATNTISISDDEKWLIQSLPTDWVPNTSKSAVIERLQEKQRIKHEETINIMNEKMIKIHEYVEFGVRLRSQEIKEELENEKQTLNKFSEYVKNNKSTSIDKSMFDIEIKNMNRKAGENSKKIKEYFEQLNNLEKERVTRIKVVLREACNALYQIGYLPPYEIQKFMENELLKINQTTLTNLRLYEDICFKLQVQNQNEIQYLILDIGKLENQWRHKHKKQILKNISSAAEESKKEVENTLFVDNNDNINSLHSVSSEKDVTNKISFKPPPQLQNSSTAENMKNFGDEILATINDLDDVTQDLVILYKNTLNMVFKQFYLNAETLIEDNDFLKEIQRDGDNVSIISSINEQHIADIIKTTAEVPLEMSFEEVLIIWNTVIDQLQKKLQETYEFVNDSYELWEKHGNRVEANQDVILRYLTEIYKSNDLVEFIYENKLNYKIDFLRDSSTEMELEKNLIKLQELLKHKGNMLNNNYQKEIDIASKYKELSKAETKVLLSEIEQFFEVHKRIRDYGPNDRITSQIPSHIKIPIQLRICDIQISSLANWRKGLSETMENFKHKGINESNEHVKEWLNEVRKKIEERKHLKILCHNERYERIQNGIYKDRLLEIRVHYDRYQSHINAFKSIFQDLSVTISDIQNRDKVLTSAYQSDVINLLTRIAKANTPVEIDQLRQEVEGMKTRAKEITKYFENSFLIGLDQIQDQVKNSNLMYLESIKLFSNGGNYSTDEAKIYINYLNETDYKINDDVKNIKYNVRRFVLHTKKRLRQMLRHLYKSLEKYSYEVTFIDKIVNHLSNLQDEIKFTAYEMKSQADRIISNINNMVELLNQLNDDNLPTESTIEHLMHHNQKLMYDIEMLTNYLNQHDNMLNDVQLPLFLSKNENSPPKSKTSSADKNTNSKNRTVKCRKCIAKSVVKSWCRYSKQTNRFIDRFSIRKKAKFLPIDYRMILFSWMPSHNSKKFIGHVCYKVFEAFNVVQNNALKFYKSKFNLPILKKDIIQPNYESFMKEILYKCKYYHIQCEELWLSVVRDIVSKIGDLKNAFLKYSNLVIEKYGNKYFNEISNTLSKFKENSHKDLKYREENWNKTRNRLKVLHGFPKNYQLLNELKTDILACAMDMHKNPWYLKEANHSLLHLQNDFQYQMNGIHNELCELLKNLFQEPHTSNLMSQMYKLLEEKNEGESDQGYARPQLIVPEEYRINIGLGSKHQLLLSHAIVDYEKKKIKRLLNELKRKEQAFKFENKLMDTISQLDSRCALIDDGSELNITCLTKNITKLFTEKINGLDLELENERTLLKQETDSWLENWTFDVEEVIKLYQLPPYN